MVGSDNGTHLRMDDDLRSISGSESRDRFRYLHKNVLPAHMFASDLDFVLIEKRPYGTVAGIDMKLRGDTVTFAEVVLYNDWIEKNMSPIFLLYADSKEAIEQGRFDIYEYKKGDPKPDPPIVKRNFVKTVRDWCEYGIWEQRLRNNYQKHHRSLNRRKT